MWRSTVMWEHMRGTQRVGIYENVSKLSCCNIRGGPGLISA